VVPSGARTRVDDDDAAELLEYHAAMAGTKGFLLHEALRIVWQSVVRGNEYVDRQAPWKLAKDPALRGDLETTLASLIRQLARHAVCLAPFMPEKAAALWTQLGAPGTVAEQRFTDLAALDATGWKVKKGEPLFPKETGKREDGKTPGPVIPQERA
jgi:methionyl-tRNA synthetase